MSPTEEIVHQQLIAYNNHDIEAYVATFSLDVTLFELPANNVDIKGKSALRDYYAERFRSNPDLRAEVVNKMLFGNFVIYEERLYGLAEQEAVDIVAIYEVNDNLIQRIWFIR